MIYEAFLPALDGTVPRKQEIKSARVRLGVAPVDSHHNFDACSMVDGIAVNPVRPEDPRDHFHLFEEGRYKATWKSPMAQGRSTIIISMIK